MEEATLDSDTDSCVFPGISAVPISFEKFGCEIIVFITLEPSGHEMGPSFDYLAHGAAVGYTIGCPYEYWALPQARPFCLHFHVPAFVCPPIRHLIEELSSE